MSWAESWRAKLFYFSSFKSPEIINLINAEAPVELFSIGVKMLHYFLYVNLLKF